MTQKEQRMQYELDVALASLRWHSLVFYILLGSLVLTWAGIILGYL